MERLTKRINGYVHGAEGRNEKSLTGSYCRGEFEATACIERLAEYENIGLLPEQIKEVDRLYAEKCRELVELKKSYLSGMELVHIWAGLEN